LSERLTAAGNYLGVLRRLADTGPRRACLQPADILQRAISQLDDAYQLFHQLRHSLEEPPSVDGRAGRDYRVCFMNRFARGNRKVTACQRMIVIRSASSRDAAIEAAKKRFTELEGIRDWHLRASMIEAALLDGDAADGRNPEGRADQRVDQERSDR
jgi:hypothetical protein